MERDCSGFFFLILAELLIIAVCKLDELIVTVILCNAIQLMEATKLIDYIYMQYIFFEQGTLQKRHHIRNVMH
jgi:hypothetical protein